MPRTSSIRTPVRKQDSVPIDATIDQHRFWRKVNKAGPVHPTLKTRCWLWTGCKTGYGYGQLNVNGIMVRAHRVAWVLFRGSIPDGMWVLHGCDVPACVNPDHLFLGDHDANMADKVKKGRSWSPAGVSHGNAKLTDEDVLAIRRTHVCAHPQLGVRPLARKYRVAHTTIKNIVLGRSWEHLLPSMKEVTSA
jgi:hypothetical protein